MTGPAEYKGRSRTEGDSSLTNLSVVADPLMLFPSVCPSNGVQACRSGHAREEGRAIW